MQPRAQPPVRRGALAAPWTAPSARCSSSPSSPASRCVGAAGRVCVRPVLARGCLPAARAVPHTALGAQFRLVLLQTAVAIHQSMCARCMCQGPPHSHPHRPAVLPMPLTIIPVVLPRHCRTLPPAPRLRPTCWPPATPCLTRCGRCDPDFCATNRSATLSPCCANACSAQLPCSHRWSTTPPAPCLTPLATLPTGLTLLLTRLPHPSPYSLPHPLPQAKCQQDVADLSRALDSLMGDVDPQGICQLVEFCAPGELAAGPRSAG